jgi:alkyl sulfatase BDS1-like metallo-beta-lactamase superfamily hydrolase
VMRHAVFAEPNNTAARELQASAFEQLAYQAESGPWRDIYLTGAKELREGTPSMDYPVRPSAASIGGMTPLQVFDYLAVRLDGSTAINFGHHHLAWHLTDTGDVIDLEISNGTLHSRIPSSRRTGGLSATIHCSRSDLNRLVVAEVSFAGSVENGSVRIDGSTELVMSLWNAFTTFKMFFPIIEP